MRQRNPPPLHSCPVLRTLGWTWEDVAVAADWAMERGYEDAWKWNFPSLPKRRKALKSPLKKPFPRIVELMLDFDLDPNLALYPDEIATGYVDAALFSTYSPRFSRELPGGYRRTDTPSLAKDGFTVDSFSPATYVRMVIDCMEFWAANHDDLQLIEEERYRRDMVGRDYPRSNLGHNFWFARNRSSDDFIRDYNVPFSEDYFVFVVADEPGIAAAAARRQRTATNNLDHAAEDLGIFKLIVRTIDEVDYIMHEGSEQRR